MCRSPTWEIASATEWWTSPLMSFYFTGDLSLKGFLFISPLRALVDPIESLYTIGTF